MKKLISILVALAMLLGCVAFAEEESFDYTGVWEATSAEIAGIAMDLAALGITASMELYEDGTCVLAMLDVVQNGTWAVTETGITTTDADNVVDTYTLVDGALVVESEGMKLIFTQMEYAEPLSGLSLADFNGNWVYTYAEAMGQVFTAEETGLSISITLQDGAGYVEFTDVEGTESIDAACEIEEIEGLGTVLYFLYLDANGAVTENGLILLMYEGEELVWLYSDESMDVFYCFERMVEAAE